MAMAMTKNKKIKLITHDGSFHTDDLFAAAALSLYFKKKNKSFEIIRTREAGRIKEGDFVFDVGGIYNEKKNRFDHHQKTFKKKRKNGIKYSSFGLIWKKFGKEITGSEEIAKKIEEILVEQIDAVDNGIDVAEPLFENMIPLGIGDFFLVNSPTWKENRLSLNKIFLEQMELAAIFLKRMIKVAKDNLAGEKIITNAYRKSKNKRIIKLKKNFSRFLIQKTLSRFREPLYVVYPSQYGKNWKIEAIVKNANTMQSRKPFPKAWRGFMDNDKKADKIIGIKGIIFSHPNGFLITLRSEEGAMKLAGLAIIKT